ncbi:MAG: esterase-like activity of phytase family protein [Siphonobacter sp.]
MNKLYFLLIFLCFSFISQAQQFHLELLKAYNLSDSTILKDDPYFGGISGIEYVPQRNKWYLVTDGKDSIRQSYLYEFDGNHFFNLNNYRRFKLDSVLSAESLRYRKTDSSFYYCTELGKNDAFGQFKVARPDSSTQSIARYERFKDNKGYEALAIQSDSLLWSISECPPPPDSLYSHIRAYDLIKQDTVALALYPLDQKICGYDDNGVSEVLITPDQQLFFMERCWGGPQQEGYTIRFYKSAIPTASKGQISIIAKQPVRFDWGMLKPDNMEGMTWGPVVNGAQTLILISDDNFHKFDKKKPVEYWQHTLMVVLKVVVD